MTEQELQREAKHRLAILRHADEISGSVAATNSSAVNCDQALRVVICA